MTPSTGTIRWGIVGAGSVCEVKSGPAFYKAPGSSVVAVMVNNGVSYFLDYVEDIYDRRNKEAAEDFAKRHNIPRFYTDLEEFLKDPEVDAVYVATPPGTHKDLALRVCSAGKPCYMEKPMARSYAESMEVKKAFEDSKLPLYIGYYRRYLPKYVYVKSIIDSGAIGQVTGVNLRLSQFRHKFEGEEVRADWRVEAGNAGGGLFMDVGSHQLDLLDLLVGPLRPLGGAARRLRPTAGLPSASFAVEDVVSFSFETQSGALGTALWNFCSGIWEDIVDVNGELGSVSFSCYNNTPVRVEIAARVVGEKTSPASTAEGDTERSKPNGAANGTSGPVKKVERLKDPEVTEYQAEKPDHVHQPLVEAVLRDLHLWWSLPVDTPKKDAVARALHDGACNSTGDAAARTAFVMDRVLEEYYGGPGSRDAEFWKTAEKWAKPPM